MRLLLRSVPILSLLSVAVLACSGATLSDHASASQSLEEPGAPVQPTDPLFGPNGIFLLARGEHAEDPNRAATHCAGLQALLERHRAGLQDTVEWRAMVKAEPWRETGDAIVAANGQGCSNKAHIDDDCSALTERIQAGWAKLQQVPAFQKVQTMAEWASLRADYYNWVDGGCS